MASIINRMVYLRDFLRAAKVDQQQRKQFGDIAPRYGERIWVETKSCTMATERVFSRRKSGMVMNGNWDAPRTPLVEIPKIAYCLRHWHEGLSWEEAGAYQYMLDLIQKSGRVDGLKTIDQVVARYAQLDTIYSDVRSSGSLHVSANAKGGAFRECGGIYVHIGHDGAPLFGRAGHHRIAIANALHISHFPAQIGVVHVDALSLLPDLREFPIYSLRPFEAS